MASHRPQRTSQITFRINLIAVPPIPARPSGPSPSSASRRWCWCIHTPTPVSGPGKYKRGDHVSTLTAWKFPTPQGADDALDRLQKLQAQQLITVQDAAVVSWGTGQKKPKTRELNSTTGRGALGGGFWGLLFGLIFFVPILGLAIGAATGALFGSLADVGISRD